MTDGFAGVSLSSVEDLLPVVRAVHVLIRHDRVASHGSDHVNKHESSPVLSLSHITNVEETIAESSRESDAILGLSLVRNPCYELVAIARR
jgi:hypothetical protein